MKHTRRSRQVSELLRDELARIIRHELNDPHLALATVTQVEVSPDLRFARVWLSALGEDAARGEALNAVQRASGRIRHHLALTKSFRWVPQLDWKLDTSAEYASRIETKLREVLPATTVEESADDDDR